MINNYKITFLSDKTNNWFERYLIKINFSLNKKFNYRFKKFIIKLIK